MLKNSDFRCLDDMVEIVKFQPNRTPPPPPPTRTQTAENHP